MNTTVAGEFNEGKKPEDNGGVQNQVSPPETATKPNAQIPILPNDKKSIEETIKDFYQKFVPGGEERVNEQIARAGTNLRKQWQVADQLANIALSPKNKTQLTEEKKKDYEDNLETKLQIYNIIKMTKIINPYQLEARWFVRKLKKAKDKLQMNYNIYSRELKGAIIKSQNADLYTKMLEILPENIKQNPDYSNLTDYLKENGCINSTGGLRAQKRELSQKERAMFDYDDLVDVFIAQMGKNLDAVKSDLCRIDNELAKKPGNTSLMQEKTAKVAYYNKLEADLDYIADHKDDLSDNLMKVGTELQTIRQQAARKSAVLLQTKECMNRLDSAINQIENYINSGKDFVAMSDHLLLIDDSYKLAEPASLAGIFADKIAIDHLDTLISKGAHGSALSEKSTTAWVAAENSIRTNQREKIAAYKAQLRPSLYR